MSKKVQKVKTEEVFANKKIMEFTIILVIFVIGILVVTNIKNDSDVITRVSRVSKDKYDTIRCINNRCNGIIVSTIKGGTSNYKIYDVYGKLVAKYSEKTNAKKRLIPYDLTKNYVLMQKQESKDLYKYYVYNKNGKKIYKTSGKLISINDNYILEEKKADIDYTYSILNKDGKKVYNKIEEYELYYNKKYLYIKKNEKKFILNSKMDTILTEYEVHEEVKDEDDTLYMIVKNTKNDLFYYFDVKTGKTKNNGFSSYSINKDKTLEVSFKENEKKMVYKIETNGKQTKIAEKKYAAQYIKNIRKKIDLDKYNIYTTSLKDENQEKIFVDNKEDKSFGIYNLKDGKYEKIYSYSSDAIYSTLNELNSKDEKDYYQITCFKPICDENKLYVYNFTDSKELFNLNGSSLVATYYTQYKNGYKTVKYSYKSEDTNYKGKYVLYDNKGTELAISNNQIQVIDSEPVIEGEEGNESTIIYSKTQNKVLNNDDSLASEINIKNEKYYRYNDSNKTYLVDSKGKEIYSTNGRAILEVSNENIYAISDKNIKIYNVFTKRTNIYNLKKGEVLLSKSNERISPYGSVLFVRNDDKNYVKVIDSNASVLKQINKTSLYKVEVNDEHKKAFIFTTSKVNKKTKYGFYIAK